MLRKAVVVCVIATAIYLFGFKDAGTSFNPFQSLQAHAAGTAEDAFRNHRSGVMVTVEGTVVRMLPDDKSGSRHQRFILRLASGQTLLIAHNIDVAPRVPIPLNTSVKLHGEYEWSEKGGTVHWTHQDPQQKHEAGWIEAGGRRYS